MRIVTMPLLVRHALCGALLALAVLPAQAVQSPMVVSTSVPQVQKLSAGDLRKAAFAAMKAKDHAQAIALWSQLLVLVPDNSNALSQRGLMYDEIGKHDKGLADHRKAIELAPHSTWAWNALCWGNILAHDFVGARSACKKAQSLDAGSRTNTLNLGHIFLLQGDKTTAWQWYEKTLKLIDNEDELKDGPLEDFELFQRKGWQRELAKQAQAWFSQEGKAWLAKKAPADKLLTEAKVAETAKDYEKSVAIREQRLSLLTDLYGENHPRIVDAQNALTQTREQLIDQIKARTKETPQKEIDTKTQMAKKLISENNYGQALILYQQVLIAQNERFGAESLEASESLIDIANCLEHLARPTEAEPLYLRALAISEKARVDNPYTGSLLARLGNLYENMGRYAEALPLYLRALAISEKSKGPDHPSTGIRLSNLAGLYTTMGRYVEAEPLYIRSLAISEKVDGPDHWSTSIKLNNLAALYKTMGRYAEALLLSVRALAISEKANGPDHPDTGNRLDNLAVLYQTMGRYAEALPLQLRALAISEKANGPDHWSNSIKLNNLAGLYQTMGRYAEALPLYVRALAISEKANGLDHPATGAHLSSLALQYKNIGRYAEAETLYIRALAIAEKVFGTDHDRVGHTLALLAGLYASMGQYTRAEPLFMRSLAITEKVKGSDASSVANRLLWLAWLYEAMGQSDHAEPIYMRALAISEKANGSEHPDTGRYLDKLGLLYMTMGRYAEALPLLIRALTITEKANGSDHPQTSVSLNSLGKLYKIMNQPERAEPLLLRAWRIASNAGDPEIYWTAQYSLRQFYSTSKPDLAIWYGKQAVNTLQLVRAGNIKLDKDIQKSFLEKNESTYKGLADLLFAQGRLMEGQQVLAMLKEAEYIDFVQRSSSADPTKTQATFDGKEQPWTDRYQQISSQLAGMSKEREALLKKAKDDADGLNADEQSRKSALDANLAVARQAYDTFMVELQREFTQSASAERQQQFGEKNLASLRSLQGTLRELGHGAVTLHYLMTDKRLWILLTTPTIQLKREAVISEADLNRQIGQYRDAVARRDPNIKALGKALYDILIAPVANDLKQTNAKTLMLSLDGSLRYLPMAALYDGEQYLAQRYQLALYTSAARDKLKDKPQTNWSMAGYGLTQKIDDFNALPSVKGELDGILEGMKGSVKFDNAFTAASFKTGLESEPPVVHLASHFVFKPGNETDSFLLLGDGKRLSLKDIKDGYEFINLDLLTLSACETAVGGGKDSNGREVEGFGAVAQNQGAKGVIATLWPVADQSTGQFMQLFYGIRQNHPGMTKAEAMQKAQQAFIEGKVGPALAEVSRGVTRKSGQNIAAVNTTDHPYYWAPFILMGNWL